MSDIQELENRIEQFKSMMSRMQYDLNSMESELKKLKAANPQQQMGANQQVRPQQVKPNQQVNPQKQVRPQQQPQNQNAPWQPSLHYQDQQSEQITPYMQPYQKVVPTAQPQNQGVPYTQAQNQGTPYAQANKQVPPAVQPNQVKPKESKLGAEGLLGKSIMGIAASILIFISIILFATLIIPMLSDVFKLILMYGVSFIVTGVGLTLWIRRDSTFFLSIGACGVGSIYISLFLTHSYFHMIDKIALYVLILIWAAAVLYLSKRQQRLFEIIGNSGIFISVVFGTLVCISEHDSSMMIVLIIYFIIGTLAYTLFRIKDNISFLTNCLCSVLNALVLLIGGWIIGNYLRFENLPHSDMYYMMGILATFCVAMMLFAMLREKELELLPLFAALAFCVIHLFSIRAMLMCDSRFVMNLTMLILCSNYYIFLEVYARIIRKVNKDCKVVFNIWKALLLIIAVTHIYSLKTLSEYVGLFMFIFPLLVLGYLTTDKFSKVAALSLYGILIFNLQMNEIMLFIYVISTFLIANVLEYMYKNQYSSVIKSLIYLIFMTGLTISVFNITIIYVFDFYVVSTLMIFILGGLNLAAAKTRYGKHWLTTDDETIMTIICYTINAILMIFGIIIIYSCSGPYVHFFVTIGLVGLALINSISFLKTKNTVKSVYVGIKFTILLIIILNSYYVPNYILSIAAFLLAIAIIVGGFYMNIKSLRLYGLIVSMVFIFKLVMVDISYNNTLGNAASFFISGVLCFVISAMYNLADKKMNKEENEKTEKTISY